MEMFENDDVCKKWGLLFLRGLVWIENNVVVVLIELFLKVLVVVFLIMLD